MDRLLKVCVSQVGLIRSTVLWAIRVVLHKQFSTFSLIGQNAASANVPKGQADVGRSRAAVQLGSVSRRKMSASVGNTFGGFPVGWPAVPDRSPGSADVCGCRATTHSTGPLTDAIIPMESVVEAPPNPHAIAPQRAI